MARLFVYAGSGPKLRCPMIGLHSIDQRGGKCWRWRFCLRRHLEDRFTLRPLTNL